MTDTDCCHLPAVLPDAQALLELGIETGTLDRLVDELTSVAAAWETSAELRNALENPLVAHEAKRAVMTELSDQIGATPTTRNALLLLVDRRRTQVLPQLAKYLREFADARKGVVRADNCAPIGRTANGELVYSMKCDNIPAPVPPPQAKIEEPATTLPPPPDEGRTGLFGWSFDRRQSDQ